MAAKFLQRAGYRILARNQWTRHGEIDLIAESPEGAVVVVEVKTREGQAGPVPEARVGGGKRRKLIRLGRAYVKRAGLLDRPLRYDVIGVDLIEGSQPVVRHRVDAFRGFRG